MEHENPNIEGILAGLKTHANVLSSLLKEEDFLRGVESLLEKALLSINNDGKIMICGNGGFSAIAQHTASELMGKLRIKRNPIPAIALATDLSVLTCIANDFGFERIFSREVEALGKEGDLLIVLSTSGRSKNVLQALCQAREQKIPAFAFVGKGCGSLCCELGSNVIELPVSEPEMIQDLTMIILHLLCAEIEKKFINKNKESNRRFWKNIIEEAKTINSQILILDRDGVVNHLLPNDYVLNPKDLKMNEDFLFYCRALKDTFKYIFVVTNQTCLGKGKATWGEVDKINSIILNKVEEAGGKIDKFFISPDANPSSPLRKPNIGMKKLILEEFPELDLKNALVVGDSFSDEIFSNRLGAHYFNLKNI